jgi:hypothetical protein
VLRRWIIGTILLAGSLALVTAGCGGSSETPAPSEAGKAAAPRPRPGEDVMKEQMLLLQKKGMLSKVPGAPPGK